MPGADARGQRLNMLYRENIDEAQILQSLDPLLARFAAERASAEGFGDFLIRTAIVKPATAPPRAIALEMFP